MFPHWVLISIPVAPASPAPPHIGTRRPQTLPTRLKASLQQQASQRVRSKKGSVHRCIKNGRGSHIPEAVGQLPLEQWAQS